MTFFIKKILIKSVTFKLNVFNLTHVNGVSSNTMQSSYVTIIIQFHYFSKMKLSETQRTVVIGCIDKTRTQTGVCFLFIDKYPDGES